MFEKNDFDCGYPDGDWCKVGFVFEGAPPAEFRYTLYKSESGQWGRPEFGGLRHRNPFGPGCPRCGKGHYSYCDKDLSDEELSELFRAARLKIAPKKAKAR